MSNESSASETTPLRRPEESYRQKPEDSTSSSSSTSATVDLLTRNGLPPPVSQNSATESLNYRRHPSNTVAIANHNNNNIEVRISSHQNADSGTPTPFYLNMDTNKRILYRVGLDVLILLCVLFPVLCFYLWGESYKRGFFCDDESLMHPFKDSTISNWMLYMIGLVLPVGVIIIVEIIVSRRNEKITNGNSTDRRYVFMGYEIPEWLVQCYKKVGIYGFGAAAGQLTTDIAKYSIGRLRPHFFAVCQPIMPDDTTCADPINHGRYIQDFRCQGFNATARMVKESTLSFPSGHSSFSFYAMVYLAIYLQARMTWKGSKLMRHFLQFVFIMIAWYTALSRVSDYKHHWSDVLSGSLIGTIIAVIVANYVSDLFKTKCSKAYVLPSCTRDVTPQTITTNGMN